MPFIGRQRELESLDMRPAGTFPTQVEFWETIPAWSRLKEATINLECLEKEDAKQ